MYIILNKMLTINLLKDSAKSLKEEPWKLSINKKISIFRISIIILSSSVKSLRSR